MTRLSACLIVRDEEQHLPDCLASVAFCDEVVVVDSGSTDNTVAIAEAAGARVVRQPWLGYGAQRNVALDHARGEWVLEIDGDERVSDQLRQEILAFVGSPPPGVDLGGLPLREVFLGRPLGPAAKYPKYRHRFLRRSAYRHDEARTVHEGLVPHGEVHAFTGDLMHLIAADWREAIGDTWRYARLEAGQLQAPRSARAFVAGALARPAVKVGYRLFVDGGWRDGWRGLARIALDSGGDALVWIRHALGRSGDVTGRSGVAAGLHFGAWRRREGCARLVVVALGAAAVERATRWTAAARAAGADAVLVAGGAAPAERWARRLGRGTPLTVARAVEREEQLRPIDAVVAVGRAARTSLRVLPPAPRDAPHLDGDALAPAAAIAQGLEARP